MGETVFDAIVIGAGPGGVSCAALLAKKGMKVLLIEKNDRAGGKAMTVSKHGFTYELWPISGVPMFNSKFDELLNELGLECQMARSESPHTLYYRNQSGEYRPYEVHVRDPQQEIDPEASLKFLEWLGVQGKDLNEVARFQRDIMSITPQEIDVLDNMTYHEFLSCYKLPSSFYSYMAAMQNIGPVLPIDQAAASESVKMFRDSTANGIGYYSKGGYGRIFERCVEAIKRDGAEICFQTRVERIVVESGQVKGVLTDKGTYNAPVVISNVGLQPTVLKLVGEEHFDKGYVNYVKDLVPSLGLMGTRYFLDRPLLESRDYIIFSDDSYWNTERSLRARSGEVPEELLVFAIIPSNIDPDLSPPGKQCVLASTPCPADPLMKNKQRWWDKLDKMMGRIWPEFPRHIEFKENFSTEHVSILTRDQVLPGIGGECIGLGQVVGQCGRHKPSSRAPIRGLFYVGCDAGGSGCGTDQAVESAFNVTRLVQLYRQMHGLCQTQ